MKKARCLIIVEPLLSQFFTMGEKIEGYMTEKVNDALLFPTLSSHSFNSFQMDFYSINIPPPPTDAFDNVNIIQLAQIETWNNEIMDVHWRPTDRQLLICIGDEWFVQPDTADVVTSLATLFACDEYQIRLGNMAMNGEIATPETLWTLYNSNWLYYADNNAHIQFSADVDYDADSAPQWVDIVPDSQPFAPMPDILLE